MSDKKVNVRTVQGRYTCYRFGGRFDVIEDGNVTYIRDVLALVGATEAGGMPHPVKTPLRWLNTNGGELEILENLLDKAWKDYLTMVENETILSDFKKLKEDTHE